MGVTDHRFSLGSLVLFLLAAIIFLIGFGAPNWVSIDDMSQGLWQTCSATQACHYMAKYPETVSGYIRVTQGLEILALLAMLSGGLMMLASVAVGQGEWYKLAARLAVGAIFVAAVFSLLAVIVYAAKTPFGLDYAFYFTLLASLGFFLLGVIIVFDTRLRTQTAVARVPIFQQPVLPLATTLTVAKADKLSCHDTVTNRGKMENFS